MLADWLTAADNPWFSRNLANRLWAHFLGNEAPEEERSYAEERPRRGECRGCETGHGRTSYFTPENRNELTNCRWNSAKAVSSGAATRKVPAAMTPGIPVAEALHAHTVAGWVAGSMHVLVVGVVSVAMLVAHAFVNVLVLVALRRV